MQISNNQGINFRGTINQELDREILRQPEIRPLVHDLKHNGGNSEYEVSLNNGRLTVKEYRDHTYRSLLSSESHIQHEKRLINISKVKVNKNLEQAVQEMISLLHNKKTTSIMTKIKSAIKF